MALSFLILASVAVVWTRLPGMVRYPQQWLAPSPATTLWGSWEDE